MRLEKYKTEFGTDITLIDDDKSINMAFMGNLDLYWTIRRTDNKKYIMNEHNKDFFIIDKGNSKIYELFEKLYEDIKSVNVFEDLEDEERKFFVINNSNYSELFNEETNTITWYSDETNSKISNYLKIIKEADSFALEFNTQPYIDGYERDFNSAYSIPIRFRNSGSKYKPFNIVFMRMYEELLKVDDVNAYGHQITISEFLYNKKLELKNEVIK